MLVGISGVKPLAEVIKKTMSIKASRVS
jgi:hypothetical protein